MTENNDATPINVETLSETENYAVWRAQEPDEVTYHVEIGPVTAHFFNEEWAEFKQLIHNSANVANEPTEDGDDGNAIAVELDWGSLVFTPEEWTEFVTLINQVS